jgi:hypothetical protein
MKKNTGEYMFTRREIKIERTSKLALRGECRSESFEREEPHHGSVQCVRSWIAVPKAPASRRVRCSHLERIQRSRQCDPLFYSPYSQPDEHLPT